MFLIKNQLTKLSRISPLIESCYQLRKFTDKSTNEESERKKSEQNLQRALITRGSFENITSKNRNTYLEMVKIFIDKDIHRRGHVEFIHAALKNMEEFGCHRDLEVYKALTNVLPKGKFIPTNIFQAEFMHYPKQQQVIIDLLEQMEDNGVIPDYEMEDILMNIFGRKGHPVRKFWRMMYWMPKFKNLSPWLLPNPVPDDILELSKLAVERMCSVDLKSKILVYSTNEVESSLDDTWIVSGQSPEQIDLLKKHSKDTPLHIEGPFLIWLRNRSVNYFTLRGDSPEQRRNLAFDEDDPDDVSQLKIPKMGLPDDKRIALKKSVHEQDDGTIYAICVTGTSTKDSLLSWIRLLEQDGNTSLADIPVLFKFRSPPERQIVPFKGENKI